MHPTSPLELEQKALLVERMSKCWAHGSKELRNSLIDERKLKIQQSIIAGDARPEAKEPIWETALEFCL